MKFVWVAVAVQILATLHARAEVFTALVDMEGLLNTEEELINFLMKYIQHEEMFIQKLKIYLQKYERQWREASQDIQKYLHNPINAYLMVKSLSSDWQEVEQLISVNNVYVEDFKEKKESLMFANDEDLSGAVAALMRLQDTYDLKTSAIARGEIKGAARTSQLNGRDCFELGKQAYKMGSYYHVVLWMQEALERIENEKTSTVTEKDILEYLSLSNYKQGNLRQAVKLTTKLLQLDPENVLAANNLKDYNAEIKQLEDNNASETPFIDKGSLTMKYSVGGVYEQLCRGEKIQASRREEELFCHYTSNNHPYYLLNPFKEETMSNDPRIVVYHDLMYGSEIELIKTIASPRLSRAKVQDSKTGNLIDAQYRISKSAWLYDNEHPVVSKISRRLEAVTGLAMDTAEPLQVVNYGIGGHYEPHVDFFRKEEGSTFKGLNNGNRIATVLFYMSDVEAGGATVFPEIGVILSPRKGSAAFWYNLHKNGDGDFNTKHAACPVLVGTKWVSNTWIHEMGQEFRYPCGLQMNE